jgi:hypothetical protein
MGVEAMDRKKRLESLTSKAHRLDMVVGPGEERRAEHVEELLTEALHVANQLEDRKAVAGAHDALAAHLVAEGYRAQKTARHEQHVPLYRQFSLETGTSYYFAQAAAHYEQSLALYRQLGDDLAISQGVDNLAETAKL